MKNAGAHAVMQYLPYMTKLFYALAVVIALSYCLLVAAVRRLSLLLSFTRNSFPEEVASAVTMESFQSLLP